MGFRKQTDKQLTSDGKTITLGHKYRDIVHGIEGTAVAKYEFLMGCDRVNLEFVANGEVKSHTVDVPQLEEVGEPPKVKPVRSTGGPEKLTPPSVDPSPR